MKKITKELLDNLSKQAKASPRKRMNYNFHENMDDTLHRMLNAIEPGSYIQPHKHENPDKAEAFVVLRGKFLAISFDNNGTVTDHSVLSPEDCMFGVDIKPRVWHTIIALEQDSIIYECKDGPWQQMNDKNFAEWAPKEGDENAQEYMQNLIDSLT